MNDVMLDLETMGTSPSGAIVAIGAVFFDMDALGREFYVSVDLASSVKHGGVMDARTVMWWMEQSIEARLKLTENPIALPDALDKFREFLGHSEADRRNVRIWGNGSPFDNVLLSQAYRNAGKWMPWSFRNDMCYRTLKNMNPDVPYPERVGVHHNALDDAKTQAIHMQKIMKALAVR